MGNGRICSIQVSGIATSLSRYTPISNSPFSHSLNLGARFLLGGRIVTPASRTVRAGPVDSPPGIVQIFIWMVVGPTCHSSLPPHSVQSRAELVRSPRRRSLPSISLLRPPNLDSSRGNLPRHLLHLPQPLDRLLTVGIIPRHRRSPWEVLEALLHRLSASPVVLRSNRPREWVRGEFLALPGLFPLPRCVAGAGERPPLSPPDLLPPVARVKSYASRTIRLGGADSPPVRLDFVQRRWCLWWFSGTELRTVRYRRADGPL